MYKKTKLRLKKSVIKAGVYVLAAISVLMLIYIIVGGNKYETDGSDSFSTQTDNTGAIKDLASSVTSGGRVNDSFDNKTVVMNDRIDITKGEGDFVNIPSNGSLANKSYTFINSTGFSWTTEITAPYTVNEELLKEAVRYNDDGIVKLFDRYIFVAVGTYWADKFGLKDGDQGKTYKVFLSTGATYDVICVDVKASGDAVDHDNDSSTPPIKTSYNAPNGKSIAHRKNEDEYCVTEFYIITYNNGYPVRPAIGENPEINYESTLKEGTHVYPNGEKNIAIVMGNFNYSPLFRGEVIAIQHLEDSRVTDLLNTAVPAYIEKYGG